jgi:hypothetical protein
MAGREPLPAAADATSIARTRPNAEVSGFMNATFRSLCNARVTRS